MRDPEGPGTSRVGSGADGSPRADHRNRRTGRLVPRRAAARARLTRSTGLDRPGRVRSPNLDGDARERFTAVDGDLLDAALAARARSPQARPDELYHLAAPTFVPDSWDDPTQTIAAIAGATATVLAAALALRAPPRVWVSTSSEVFGDAPQSPQNEDTPMRPRTPYGVAKLAAHGLVRTMREHHGLFACSGITYNHESPRRPPHFLPRKVTRGAAAIALGLADELVLGDLDAVRDWSDARDIVRGGARSRWTRPSPATTSSPAGAGAHGARARRDGVRGRRRRGRRRAAGCASTRRSCARPSRSSLVGDTGRGARGARLGAARSRSSR